MIDDAMESTAATGTQDLPITRDDAFARYAPDVALVMDRGSDFDFSLIMQEALPIFQVMEHGEGGLMTPSGAVKMQASSAELARFRLSHSAAMAMAMAVIEQALKAGRVNVPAFQTAVDALIQDHGASIKGDRDDSAATDEP